MNALPDKTDQSNEADTFSRRTLIVLAVAAAVVPFTNVICESSKQGHLSASKLREWFLTRIRAALKP